MSDSLAAEYLYGPPTKPVAQKETSSDPIADKIYGGGGTSVKVSVDVTLPEGKSASEILYGSSEKAAETAEEEEVEDLAAVVCDLFEKHSKEPADDASIAVWATECRQHLHNAYGDQAEDKLAMVNEYLADHPDLVELLIDSGLGSHAKVVKHLISRVDEMHRSGKFKSKKEGAWG